MPLDLSPGKAERAASPIQTMVSTSPLPKPQPLTRYLEGITLAEMADRGGLERGTWAAYRATITLGTLSWEIPAQHWAATKPHGGAIVEIVPLVHGPAVAAIGSALITSFAPTIAASLFGTGLLAALATAAISIVGTLALNSLIQPPEPQIGDTTPFYGIGAPANRVERYAPVAYPVGRHLAYPQPAATGYSETREDTVIYHGLFVLGYGPIGVEEPRFGNVPLSDFDDVELEFRFVDEAYTAPHMAGINKVTYRERTQQMKLYPGNIAEDNEVATFGDPNDITRRTRPETVRATVVLHFPEGLFKATREGNDRSRRREFYFEYRKVGDTTWTDLPFLWVERERRTAFSVEYDIEFPEAGQYDIRTTYSGDSDNDSVYDTAQLIAIRSEREAPLPLNPELAVVAVRIRASKQLSGGLDRLNFVLRQFAPKWTGSGWSGFEPVDHPAWSYAEALAGLSAGENRIDRSLIDGDSLKAWADQEPDWRCDLLVRGNQRIQQLVNTICAAGRARDTFIGTRSGVVRETAGQPVEALLTTRNSRGGFRAEHRKIAEFHALRVKAISERLEWQEDEIIVYRDGQSFETASKFLDLSLVGTVIGKTEENAGNAWRLARYFMAELLLRPEEIQIPVELHHLALRIGSKFRFQHDVRLNGVGSARILEIAGDGATARLTLDEEVETPAGEYRLSVWNTVSELVTATARQDRPPLALGDWSPQDPSVGLARTRTVGVGVQWTVPSGERIQGQVFRIAGVALPSAPVREALTEIGGGGNGFAIYVDGGLMIVQASAGAQGATGQARIAFDYSAYRGHEIDLTVEIDVSAASLRLWFDRRLVARATANGGAFAGGAWTGANEGHHVTGHAGSVPAGVPQTDWTRSAGPLEIYGNQIVSDPPRGRDWICATDISGDIEIGDLTVIERLQDAERDLIVTRIVPEADGMATLYAVDAAPEILQADQGPIPTYDPDINTDLIGIETGPDRPVILAIRSDLATALVRRSKAVPLPRIGVATRPPISRVGRAVFAQIQWRQLGDRPWSGAAVKPWEPELFTAVVQEGVTYEVRVQFLDEEGRTRGFVSAGVLEASVAAQFIFPPTGWAAQAGIDTITLRGDESINEDFAEVRAYAQVADGQPEIFVAASAVPVIVLRPDPAIGATGYVIREALHTGALSDPTPFLPAVPTGVAESDLVNPLRYKIEEARTTADTAIAEIDVVEANIEDVLSLGAVTTPGGEIIELKIVSYTDPTGATSGALQFNGQLIVDGTIGANSLVVSDFSGNLVRDAPFFTGDVRPWDVRSAQIELVEGQISDGYPDKHVLRFPVNPANLRVIIEPSTPCEAGAFYSVRFPLFCTGSCRLLVSFQFKKATGGTFSTRLVGQSAGSFPAWTVFEGQVQAPAEAVSMRIDIVRAARSDDVGAAFFGRAIVRRKATATTVVTPNSITTDLIDVQDFSASGLAVFGGSLQSDNYQPLPNLRGFQINRDGTAFFGSDVTIRGALKRSAFAGGELTVPIEPLDVEYIDQSVSTFRFKRSGLLDLYVIGGGGSGGAAVADLGPRQGVAGGGAAGGCVRQYIVEANTTDTFTITIGAGGEAVSQTGTGATRGNGGSRSRFTGPGLDLIANGGEGGRAATSTTLPVSVPGVKGGAASGGDGNFRGGDSGGARCTVDGDLGAASGAGALSFNLLDATPSSPGAVNGAGDDGKPIPDVLDGVQSSPIPFLRMGDGYNFQGGNARVRRNGTTLTKGGNGRFGTGGAGAVANGDSGVAAQAEGGEGGRGFVVIFYRGGLDLAGGA